MKCLVVVLISLCGCALAQNFNDGQYRPELLRAKFDDGQYRPDSNGAYRPGSSVKIANQGAFGASRGRGSGGAGSRLGSSNGNRFGGGAPARVAFVPAPAPVFAATSPGFSVSKKNKGFGSSNKLKSASNSGSQDGIKEDTREMNEDGFFYRFVNDNQIEVSATGRIENRGSENEVLRANGYYEFVGDDGIRYRVDYIADENGFQPSGDHLPTPPPIPDEIIRALQLLSQS